MQMFEESQLENKEFRKLIIAEIEGNENKLRKVEAYKRYEVYKDRLKKYILEELLKELDTETVNEMQSRVSNINLYKKTINKKARVYQVAPSRSVNEGDSESFAMLIDEINLDTSMKKANRYVEAFRNVLVYVRPYKDHAESTPEKPKYNYQIRILPPFMFDVIEDSENPETIRAVILSDFHNNVEIKQDVPSNRQSSGVAQNFRDGDGKNQTIADSPRDTEKKYIFWSNKYHFTCDEKSEIIAEQSPEDYLNPIGKLPFISLAKDQDGSFYSLGGEDLIDGTLLTNVLLTDLYFISKVQGMGIFYYFGKGVPNTFKVGPNRGITHEVGQDDPTPQVGFANSSPPLNAHMEMIEQYVAFLLTTNDLGVNAVSSKLDGRSAISGVQELIQNSEPMNAIEDDQEMFKDNEPLIIDLVTRWHNYYFDKGALVSNLEQLGKLPEYDYTMTFAIPQQFRTEEQKIEVMKVKKELGIVDEVAILMELNPELSEDEAIEQIRQIKERKLKESQENMRNFMGMTNGDDTDENSEEIEPESDENSEE